MGLAFHSLHNHLSVTGVSILKDTVFDSTSVHLVRELIFTARRVARKLYVPGWERSYNEPTSIVSILRSPGLSLTTMFRKISPLLFCSIRPLSVSGASCPRES